VTPTSDRSSAELLRVVTGSRRDELHACREGARIILPHPDDATRYERYDELAGELHFTCAVDVHGHPLTAADRALWSAGRPSLES